MGIVQLLLDKDADVNAQGGECINTLYATSYRGHTEIVQLLLDKGADAGSASVNPHQFRKLSFRFGIDILT
jgi:ankyrin repeat protein